MRNVLDFSQVSGQILYSVCGEAAIEREMACTLETVMPSHSTDRPQEYNNTVRYQALRMKQCTRALDLSGTQQ